MNSESLASILEDLVNIPSETGHEARDRRLGARRGSRAARQRRDAALGQRRGVARRRARAPARRTPAASCSPATSTPCRRTATRRARREDGKLYGVGSTDMKGGDAVMLALVETLDPARAALRPRRGVLRRRGGPARGQRAQAPARRDAVARARRGSRSCSSPPTSRSSSGCNGAMNAEVRVTGKSAHSARPWTRRERGRARRAVARRGDALPGDAGRASQGVEFVETLQVTTLAPGRARNVVPDELVANLNYRFPPDRTPRGRRARGCARWCPPSSSSAWWTAPPPGTRVRSTSPRCASSSSASAPTVAGKQGWTDVAQFTAAGHPGVQLRPGHPRAGASGGRVLPDREPRARLPLARRVPGDGGARERAAARATRERPGPAQSAAHGGREYPFVTLDARRRELVPAGRRRSSTSASAIRASATPAFIREALRARGARGVELSRGRRRCPSCARRARAGSSGASACALDPERRDPAGERHQGGGVPARARGDRPRDGAAAPS